VAGFFERYAEKFDIDQSTIKPQLIEDVENDIYDEMMRFLCYCDDPFCDIDESHKHGPICHMNCSCKRKR